MTDSGNASTAPRWLTVFGVLAILLSVGSILFAVQQRRARLDQVAAHAEDVRDLRRSIRALDDELASVIRDVERVSSSASTDGSSSTESFSELLLHFSGSIQHLEGLVFDVAVLLGGIESAIDSAIVSSSGAGGVDVVARAQALNLLSEKTLRLREERLQQFDASNRRLRRQWISMLADDLGLDQQQYRGVVDLYDQQAIRWTDLYSRMQSDGLSQEDVIDEISEIRKHADRELERLLGRELKERFRLGESSAFPSSDDRGRPGSEPR